MRRSRDAMLVLAALIVAGVVILVLAWLATTGIHDVPFQVPRIMTGGAIALALIGLAVAAVDIQMSRRENAVLGAETERVMADLVDFVVTEPELDLPPAAASTSKRKAPKATSKTTRRSTKKGGQ